MAQIGKNEQNTLKSGGKKKKGIFGHFSKSLGKLVKIIENLTGAKKYAVRPVAQQTRPVAQQTRPVAQQSEAE